MCNFGKPHAVPSSVFIIPRRRTFVKGGTIKNLDKIRHGLYTIPWKAAFVSRFLFKLHTAGGWSPFHYSIGISFWFPEMNHERGCYMMEFYFLMALLMLIVLERILNGRDHRN